MNLHRRLLERGMILGLAALPLACSPMPAPGSAPAGVAPATTAAASPAPACAELGATADLHVTLMFGLSRPHGAAIKAQEWTDFVRDVITPRFPLGITVLEAHGQWQDRVTGRIGAEPSRLVWIATPDLPDLRQRLDAIRTGWKTKFDQQSVGLVVTSGCESF